VFILNVEISVPIKKLILLLSAFSLYGCSVLAYTPVVATESLGLNQTDLSDSSEFKEYISRPFLLVPVEEVSWQLKKFDGGRYHIELAANLSKKEVICELIAGSVIIEKIFDDSMNGGLFYSAKISCNGHTYSAPLNHWSNPLRRSIKFIANST
jgi:hypothetical protein